MVAVEDILKTIKQLPPNELSYYCVLLLAILQDEPDQIKKQALLVQLLAYVQALQAFYASPNTQRLQKIIIALDCFIDTAQTTTLLQSMLAPLLMIIGVLCAVVGGIIGVCLGMGLGMFCHPNPFKGLLAGIQIGLVVGMTLGYRLPTKVTSSAYTDKLNFCIASLQKVTQELTIRFRHPNKVQRLDTYPYEAVDYEYYQNETECYLKETCFKDAEDPDQAFVDFLKTPQYFQVCTTPSGLVDRDLDGTLGHHGLIRYRINGQLGIPMEFGDRKSNPNWVAQAESPREVTGEKLFDMLVLDRILNETHPKNLKFTLTDFRSGDNDCLTYVNKILIGTHQAPALIRRFAAETDTWLGQPVSKHCIEFVRATTDEDLEKIAPFFQNHAYRTLGFYQKPTRDTQQYVPGWTLNLDCS